MRIWIGVAVIAVAVGCGKKKDGPKAQAEDKVEQPTPAPAKSSSSLWDLAPAGAVGGLVFNPGSLEKLYAGFDEARKIAGADPVLGPLVDKLVVLSDGPPFDIFSLEATVRDGGVDPSLGFAVFFDAKGEPLLAALPVADMTKLEKFMGEPGEDIEGRRVFAAGDRMTCAVAGSRVVCAPDLTAVDASLEGGGSLIDGVPPRARGDVEVVYDFGKTPDVAAKLGAVIRNPGKLAVAVKLDGGVVAVNAHIAGQVAAPALASRAPSLPVGELDRDAVGLVRVHWDAAAALELVPLPPALPLVPGFDARKDFLEQMSGEVVIATMTGGDATLVVGIALRDSSALKQALPALCKTAAQKIPQLNLEPAGDTCNATFELPPIPDLPAGLVPTGPMRASFEVRSGAAWITAGDLRRPSGGIPNASAHTAAFRDTPATVSAWGRSFDPFAAIGEESRAALDRLIADNTNAKQRAGVRAGRWIAAHIAEAGFSMSFDDTGASLSFVVATFAADPKDVYAAYEAAVQKDLSGDYAGYRAAMKALATKPDTLAGAQAAIVERGAPPIGAGTGILAAIAIPAFVKYTAKSEMADAFRQIKQIYETVEPK